jgi:phage gpG-like protein
MSLQIRDNISPALARMMARCKDRRPILEAMGQQLVTITKKAFNDASLRAATWPAKRDGSAATLKKTGMLWQSIRITEITNTSVTVGSDRPYAAVHQLGSSRATGRGGGIPARPFFPFLSGNLTALAAKKIEDVAARAAKRQLRIEGGG